MTTQDTQTEPRRIANPAVGESLARVVVTLVAGFAFYVFARFLNANGSLPGPNNVFYISVVGLLLGYLLSGLPAKPFGRLWAKTIDRLATLPAEVVLAAVSGATLGLIVTILLNNVLASVPGFTWYWSQLIAVVIVAGLAGFFVANRRMLPFLRPSLIKPPTLFSTAHVADKVVDTSAIIDGRLGAVADANFLEGKLLVPHFVLGELQRIADSEEQLRRQRGRRGLEVLDELMASDRATEITYDDEGGGPVDDRLVRLCQGSGASLVTTDFNLERVAALQGVRVLNLNKLASALKTTLLPGERISLTIVKQGREVGQGLAYLEDGTMVVVDGAGDSLGETLVVVVTSSLQTNMGRMIFARPEPTDQPG